MNPQQLAEAPHAPALRSSRKDHSANTEAQNDWRALGLGTEDVELGFQRYTATHGKIRPEAFTDNGRYKTRRGYELLRGKERNGVYSGGSLGKARVLAGRPLELRRVPFSAVPGLENLELDPRVQFDPELVRFAINALKPFVDGPASGCIEIGRVSKANHFHIFAAPGACKLGVSNGVIPDDQLLQKAAYLGKAPPWNSENALAYLNAKRALAGKDVPSRYLTCHLGNSKTRLVTLAMIEEALGYSLAKPEATPEPKVEAAAVLPAAAQASVMALLPQMQGATPQEAELVAELYLGWSEGRYNGLSLKLQGRTYPDLGQSLSYDYARKKLFPGEVANLVDIALALGLSSNTSKAVKSRRSHTGHVRPYSSPHKRPSFQTGHVVVRGKMAVGS